MPDSEKTLAARDSTSNDPTSNKEERGESLREPSPLSKQSLEKGEHDSHEPNDADEDASKESESKGGVGVYFVSAPDHRCDMLNITDDPSESSNTQTASTVFSTPYHVSEPSFRAHRCR